jgi:hypothetical protein
MNFDKKLILSLALIGFISMFLNIYHEDYAVAIANGATISVLAYAAYLAHELGKSKRENKEEP